MTKRKFCWKAAAHSAFIILITLMLPVGVMALLGFDNLWSVAGHASFGGFVVATYLLWKRDFFNE